MTSKIEFTRKELNHVAKLIGIKKPRSLYTDELLDAFYRCDSKREVENSRKELLKLNLEKIAKLQNILENDLSIVKKLQNRSIDELREIARLRGNKVSDKPNDKLTKEDIIISLLKSESNAVELNYMEYFNNSTSNDIYDDEIKSKINDIRLLLSRLGNIVSDRKKIKKELYEIEIKQNLSDNEKEKIYDHLVKLVNKFDKKEEYKRNNRDGYYYFGIKELKILLGDIDDYYYKPVLVRSSFKKNYEYYESRGDKEKKRSVKEYLYVTMSYLSDLINNKKNTGNGWKIQINMGVKFISSKDTGETRTCFVHSDSEDIRSGNETVEIINKLLKSFLNNYQNEEKILRNGTEFVFESVDLLAYHIHKINLKRGKS